MPQPKKQPHYRRIADDLRAKIESGDLEADGKLPSEAHLVQQYGVAHGTVRQAFDLLENEGLTVTVHGKGVFARRWHPLLRSSPRRLSADQWGSGRAIWEVDLDGRQPEVEVQLEKLPATVDVARQLEIGEGEYVWKRARRFLLDGSPVQLAVSHLPAELAEGTAITQVDTGPGGAYARLAEVGHAPVRFTEVLHCRMPKKAEVEQLALPPATPVAEITRIAYDANDRPVEVNDMLLNADRYLLEYNFPA